MTEQNPNVPTVPADRTAVWPKGVIPRAAVGPWRALVHALEGAPPICETDPDAWWSSANSSEGLLVVEAAVYGCSRCSAREACLAYALAAGEAAGIWGGATPTERAAMRRGRGGAE